MKESGTNVKRRHKGKVWGFCLFVLMKVETMLSKTHKTI